MINRRNIRVKVMQLLYALEAGGAASTSKLDILPERQLQRQINQTRSLLVFELSYIIEIARYAEVYAQQRLSKNIVTEEDRNISIKIAGNEVLWLILENSDFKNILKQGKIDLLVDRDLVKKLFLQLLQTEEYTAYTAEQSRNKKTESAILQFIFTNILMESEDFLSRTEELFSNWDDDGEITGQITLQYINKPQSIDLRDSISPDKWIYAKDLLNTVLEKETILSELITPKLKNWDPDRIAVVDMLLLKMGVSELLFFETIPTKVTINEYIDIAKEYSTKQSGQFVNGILDSIHKDLISQNKIHKIDFRKNNN